MDATLHFGTTPPATRSLVFSGSDRGGQGLIANAGIALVVQGVVKYPVVKGISPDLFCGSSWPGD